MFIQAIVKLAGLHMWCSEHTFCYMQLVHTVYLINQAFNETSVLFPFFTKETFRWVWQFIFILFRDRYNSPLPSASILTPPPLAFQVKLKDSTLQKWQVHFKDTVTLQIKIILSFHKGF